MCRSSCRARPPPFISRSRTTPVFTWPCSCSMARRRTASSTCRPPQSVAAAAVCVRVDGVLADGAGELLPAAPPPLPQRAAPRRRPDRLRLRREAPAAAATRPSLCPNHHRESRGLHKLTPEELSARAEKRRAAVERAEARDDDDVYDPTTSELATLYHPSSEQALMRGLFRGACDEQGAVVLEEDLRQPPGSGACGRRSRRRCA